SRRMTSDRPRSWWSARSPGCRRRSVRDDPRGEAVQDQFEPGEEVLVGLVGPGDIARERTGGQHRRGLGKAVRLDELMQCRGVLALAVGLRLPHLAAFRQFLLE